MWEALPRVTSLGYKLQALLVDVSIQCFTPSLGQDQCKLASQPHFQMQSHEGDATVSGGGLQRKSCRFAQRCWLCPPPPFLIFLPLSSPGPFSFILLLSILRARRPTEILLRPRGPLRAFQGAVWGLCAREGVSVCGCVLGCCEDGRQGGWRPGRQETLAGLML